MSYFVLVDVTRCIGCQGCQVACKNWNERPSELTRLGETLGNPPDMDARSYTVVKFNEGMSGGVKWHFTKQQCMHCAEPACVAACPCSALTKDELGPVEYHRDRCIGCRYCMLACPFKVPAFEWDRAIPSIRKCTFCSERIKAGMEPACTKSCPSGALTFGERETMLALAKRRIASGRYVNYIYGRDEVGGTSWLYITDTDFRNLYLREDLGKSAYGAYAYDALGKLPAVALGAALALGGFYFIAGRRDKHSAGKEGK